MKKTICLITLTTLLSAACLSTAFAADSTIESKSAAKFISSHEESRVYSGDELLYIMTTDKNYDEMGSMIHSVEVTDYLDGYEAVPVTYDYDLTYNEQGLISSQLMMLNGILFCERSFEYDDHGNQTKMVEVNIPNTYTFADENMYSDDGQLIGKVEHFTLSRDEIVSESTSTYTFTYNDAGLLTYLEYTVEAEGMDPITNSISYEYDAAGNISSEIQKYGTDSESVLTYSYVIAPDGSIESTDVKTVSRYTDMEDIITETTITYQYSL